MGNRRRPQWVRHAAKVDKTDMLESAIIKAIYILENASGNRDHGSTDALTILRNVVGAEAPEAV